MMTRTTSNMSALVLVTSSLLALEAHAAVVNVDNVIELVTAVQAADPGDEIVLAPGTYQLESIVEFTRAGTALAPIVLRASPDTVTLRGNDVRPYLFDVRAPYWTFQDLKLTQAATAAIVFRPGSHDVRVRAIQVPEIRAMGVSAICGGIGVSDGCPRITIEDSTFAALAPLSPTDCYGAAIDVEGGVSWTIQRNTISGMRLDGLVCPETRAFGIVLRGGSTDPRIEANLVINNYTNISLGGKGTPACRARNAPDGASCAMTLSDCETIGARILNNASALSDEVGIDVLQGCSTRIINNTLWKNGTFGPPRSIRLTGAMTSAAVINNILNVNVEESSGATHTEQTNYVLPSTTDAKLFEGAAMGKFRLVAAEAMLVIDKGTANADVFIDFEGRPRPLGEGYEIGAIEYPPDGYDSPLPIDGGARDSGGGTGVGGVGGGGQDPNGFGDGGCAGCRVGSDGPMQTALGLLLAALMLAAIRLNTRRG